jgi:glycosyltransferase involved in cell wall biosynthesis
MGMCDYPMSLSDNEYTLQQPRNGWPWEVNSPPNQSEDTNNNKWPKISVITPSFNQGDYIEETIRSVIMQNYPNLEYIIIDGGSNDNTVDIIKKYENSISYWVSEQDEGQSSAINKGFKRSSGDIIAWLNSDDIYLADTFIQMIRCINKFPDAGMIYGDYFQKNESTGTLIRINGGDFNFNRLIWDNYIPQPTVFMKSELLKTIGYLDESYHYTMDYDYWIRVSQEYPVAYCPQLLAQFRFHPESKSVKDKKKFDTDLINIFEKLLKNPKIGASEKKNIINHLFRDFVIFNRSPSPKAMKVIWNYLIH